MKNITVTVYKNGTAKMTSEDLHIDIENNASKLTIDFTDIAEDYPDIGKWVDIITSDNGAYRYDLGTDIIVSMDLRYENTVKGSVIITPFIYDGVSVKVKFVNRNILTIYNQPEAGDVEIAERDDYIFDLAERVKRLEEAEDMSEVTIIGSIPLDVNVQDQSTDIVDYYLCKYIRDLSLSIDAVVNEYTITVADATLVSVGSYVCLQENSRAFQAQILSIAGNVLTLDTPLDYGFTTSASAQERTPDLNLDGSVTPISASLQPAPGTKWDITRILLVMTHTSAGDDARFGNIENGLTKGIVLRKSDGIHHTIFNAKNNGDIRIRAFDVVYSDKAGGGLFSTSMRRSFAGQDKNGVVMRLDGDSNEKIEVLIQDDLSSLSSFKVVAQGHVVQD